MENSEKVDDGAAKSVEDPEQPIESTQEEHISGAADVIADKQSLDKLASDAEPEPVAAATEITDACEKKTAESIVPAESELTKTSEEKPDEIVLPLLEKEDEKLPEPIKACDTGGDEKIPDLPVVSDVHELKSVVEVPEDATISQSLEKEPVLLAELTTVVPEELLVQVNVAEPRSEVVAIDDDDEDDDDDDDVEEEDDDEDDEDADDDDDDDDEMSNEALNADELDLYDDGEKVRKSSSLARESLPPHPIDDFDDYDDVDDDDDDDEMEDRKDDSNVAVVIGSSDDDDEQVQTPRPTALPQKPQQAAPVRKYDDIDDDLDYEDDDEDDDDDDYDDDDLMNAVVTSASKSLTSSPIKKRPRSQSRSPSPNVARQKEAHQIDLLTRRINYGRIAKKKSLKWLYSKKKRESYKSILPRWRPISKTAVAMRSSDQSGGLLHLKITPPSVASIVQKPLIKPAAATPIISRIESRTPAPATPQKEEYVIDLDSSPEKALEKATPRNQTDDRQHLETGVKKPPDNQDETDNKSSTMQQTDKVRDSIQKSTEELVEVKSDARLTCEQNKENLQSNEALKKEKDELTTKNEAESKESAPADEAMDTVEEPTESTLKATDFTISAVDSLNLDIKEEKVDHTPATPPPTAEVASKVTIEDVQEKEIPRLVASPQPPQTVVASKRRRSSSTTTQDRSKLPKSAALEPDDDEEYIHPTKKLREELQSNYPTHDRILTEYIEKTSNDSIDTIQRHIEQMLSEIQTLNDMIKAKEVEWNNMLHLKKVKEEICFRLTRRKQCMEIMATKVGEAGHSAGLDEDYLGNESVLALGKTPPPQQQQQQHPQLSSTPIAAAINSLSTNICNFTAVSSSSSAAPTTAQLIIQNRANMKSSDLVKEKANTQRLHRNILPKPNTTSGPAATSSPIMAASLNNQQPSTNGPATPSSSNQPILNSYLTSADSVQQLVDMMNGHHNNHSGLQNGGAANNSQAAMVGRQGPFKDVRSIIADFRQQHPEAVPRRGRRVKNSHTSNLSDSNTILANALKSDTNSRPSSNDSSSHSLSNANQPSTNHNNVNSFKDVLAPFAKSQAAASLRSAGGQQPPYPEVTLHPVSTPVTASGGQDQPTGSLLHGILTKFSRPNESANSKSAVNQTSANYISNFSPTLARLLTAPERISAGGAGGAMGNQPHGGSAGGVGGSDGGGNAHHSMPGFGVNLSKVVGHNSEITITPVMNSMHQQSVLQQQLQQQQLKDVLTRAAAAVSGNTVKEEHFHKLSSYAAASAANDDDAEDSVDRLVIDEGVDSIVGGEDHQRIAPHAIGQEFNENEVPVCQGCKKHEAQFVCAGCGNQWYCSRECQVTAWDDHSEVCTDSDSNGCDVQDPHAETSQAARPSRARAVPRRFSDFLMESEGVED